MDLLKLIALDAEDLAIVSAHLQDACLKIGNMAYLPRRKCFAAIVSRFDWAGALVPDGKPRTCERRQSALRFERVLGAELQGVDLEAKSRALCLLAVQFEETTPPGGYVTLVFAGAAAIRLNVEYIEAELKDLGSAWTAKTEPRHPAAHPVRSE